MNEREGYKVIGVLANDDEPCECENCDWGGPVKESRAVGHCWLTAGAPSPAGRCPECDMLVYVVEATPRVVVWYDGGVIQGVLADRPMHARIIDLEPGSGDPVTEIPEVDGGELIETYANDYEVEVRPEWVAAVMAAKPVED